MPHVESTTSIKRITAAESREQQQHSRTVQYGTCTVAHAASRGGEQIVQPKHTKPPLRKQASTF